MKPCPPVTVNVAEWIAGRISRYLDVTGVVEGDEGKAGAANPHVVTV